MTARNDPMDAGAAPERCPAVAGWARSSTQETVAGPAAFGLSARFVTLGLWLLAALAVLAPWAMPLLLTHFYEPRLLAFVHLNTLGVVGAVTIGLSYRLVPEALRTPLAGARLGRLSFWCYLGGLIGLPIGLTWTWLPALAAGGTLLTIGFGLYIVVIGTTLRRAPCRDVVAWHVAVSLAGLAAGVAYGLILAINKGTGFLGSSTLHQIAAHATIMLGGWVAVLLAGIACRISGPGEPAGWTGSTPGVWLALTLIAGGAWLLSTNLHLAGRAEANLAGAAALFGGVLLAAGRLVWGCGWRAWRRHVHVPFALTASACGIVAAALLVGGIARHLPPGDSLWLIAGWLAIAGFAETAIQGLLYGVEPVPQTGRHGAAANGVDPRLALAGWALWTLGVALEAAAVRVDAEWLSREAGVLVAAGVACFLMNMVRVVRR